MDQVYKYIRTDQGLLGLASIEEVTLNEPYIGMIAIVTPPYAARETYHLVGATEMIYQRTTHETRCACNGNALQLTCTTD